MPGRRRTEVSDVPAGTAVFLGNDLPVDDDHLAFEPGDLNEECSVAFLERSELFISHTLSLAWLG